jgi:hypothetical protein
MLVEFLIAATITMCVAGIVFAFLAPAYHTFQSQPEQSDLQQRLRVSVDHLTRDLVMAGAGIYAGPALGPLTYLMAPLMPYRAFGDAPDPSRGTFFRHDAISFVYVPATPSQTTLASPLAPGALDVQLAWSPNCPAATATQVCGFGKGDRMMIVDGGSRWDIFSVERVGLGVASLGHRGAASAAGFDAGSAATFVRVGAYYLKADETSRTYQLMRHDGWATELPVVEDVVRLEFQYFGDPQPPRLTGKALGDMPGPWTTYGPAPPAVGRVKGDWPPGENCTFSVVNGEHIPRLEVLAGHPALVELSPSRMTDGPWCPDATVSNRFDADLLRVRMVRVTLRMQSALPALRGPAGALFLKGGTATAGDRYVPDIEVQFDVAPRNMNLER